MGKKFNLGGDKASARRQRQKERAEEDRARLLDNFPSELADKKFSIRPTPAIEKAEIVTDDSGYRYTEYKSLAKLSIQFDGPGGFRSIRRTLPDIFEVTEIVYSGVGPDDEDS